MTMAPGMFTYSNKQANKHMKKTIGAQTNKHMKKEKPVTLNKAGFLAMLVALHLTPVSE